MGCFSYLCKVCNDPIIFDDDINTGEHCTLYLLEKGKIIEQMTGQYNHYGCVFADYPYGYAKWKSYDWGGVCELNFSTNKNSGIVAVHTDCHPALPHPDFHALLETQSSGDPDQGTGDIKHTTEGKFSQSLIEKPKTKTPDIPEEDLDVPEENFGVNLEFWEIMKEMEALLEKLRKKLEDDKDNK